MTNCANGECECAPTLHRQTLEQLPNTASIICRFASQCPPNKNCTKGQHLPNITIHKWAEDYTKPQKDVET